MDRVHVCGTKKGGDQFPVKTEEEATAWVKEDPEQNYAYPMEE